MTLIHQIPLLYLGTMTFGWTQTSSKVTEPIALEMMNRFIDYQSTRLNPDNDEKTKIYIDTARIYAGGKTERILGCTLSKIKSTYKKKNVMLDLKIGTKAHPSQPHGLSYDGIQSQFQTSLDSMHLSAVDEFYLHQPDTENSLLESLQKAHELVKNNQVTTIGMSNYHVSEVRRAFDLCDEFSLTKPSVYQGLYNPFNRSVEKDLFPLLQEHNCAFIAYNPLAAGFLTGKHMRSNLMEDEVQKGRFNNNPNYLPRFFTHSNFDALDILRESCRKEGISLVEASFRWLLLHSSLDVEKKDGIVLGFSSMVQLEENLAGCDAAATLGPLPQTIVAAFDQAWDLIQEKGAVFPYWRSYSSDMPNKDNLDHGASYSANKAK